jgi:hypothetical protein
MNAVDFAGQVAADHRPDNRATVEIGCGVCQHVPAVAQHRDTIGILQRFLERMADEDDGDAALLEPLHQAEEVKFFLGR